MIPISRPRTDRSSRSLICSRSRPSNSAVPPVTLPARAKIPSNASDVTLLPQPDSPTIPSVSPGAMSNEMPLTAWIVPRRVQNSTRRSRTDRRALRPATELRVECLAEAVADQVEAEHRDHDREAGDDRQVDRRREVLVRVGQHRPPLGRRRILRPEAEEPEAGDVDDGGRHPERAGDDHRRDRVREDVREEDLPAWHAHDPGSE